MPIKDSTIERYLRKYAEADPLGVLGEWARTVVSSFPYRTAVVVPAFAETFASLDRLLLKAHQYKGPTSRRLVILVLNAPSSASARKLEVNRAMSRDCFARASHRYQVTPGLDLLSGIWEGVGQTTDLLLADASSGVLAFGDKDGVGRARKWGTDLALALYFMGALSCPLVGSSDADAMLPPDYFSTLEQEARGDIAGVLFPYTHEAHADERLNFGMAQVEASFRYYVLGLHAAGSPYAYHSLGSALAVSLPHYAAVRGFPRRQAGEDFYLLSKLSQVGDLLRVGGHPVRLLTRRSDRVPFGTGPRLAQWDSQAAHGCLDLYTYDPRVFSVLSEVLRKLREWASLGRVEGACVSWIHIEAERVFRSLEKSLVQCPDSEHRLARLLEGFDALATLQLIRRVTRQHFPELPLRQAIEASGLVVEHQGQLEPARLCAELSCLEEKLPRRIGPRAQLCSVDLPSHWPSPSLL